MLNRAMSLSHHHVDRFRQLNVNRGATAAPAAHETCMLPAVLRSGAAHDGLNRVESSRRRCFERYARSTSMRLRAEGRLTPILCFPFGHLAGRLRGAGQRSGIRGQSRAREHALQHEARGENGEEQVTDNIAPRATRRGFGRSAAVMRLRLIPSAPKALPRPGLTRGPARNLGRGGGANRQISRRERLLLRSPGAAAPVAAEAGTRLAVRDPASRRVVDGRSTESPLWGGEAGRLSAILAAGLH